MQDKFIFTLPVHYFILELPEYSIPDTRLSTKIPYLEFEVFVLDCFHIEPDGWNKQQHSVEAKF